MKNMIGYCGLDCEKCDAYLATINDDRKLREKTAKLWAELNNAPILPEHINCQGCRENRILRRYVRYPPVRAEKGNCYLRRLSGFIAIQTNNT